MKKLRLIICILTFISLNAYCVNASHKAITHPHHGGRLGDRIIEYIHAKWLSYKYKIPYLYHPFAHSEELYLSDFEIHFAEALPYLSPDEIYVCEYFPESKWELRNGSFDNKYFKVDCKEPKFNWMLRQMISPKIPLDEVYPPKDVIAVALHFREGGGYDPSGVELVCPSKIPPFDFYCEGLKKVLQYIPYGQVYVHVFSDAKDPQVIVDSLKEHFQDCSRMSFDYRKGKNGHDFNVLEDFFSFRNFDILIRPDSNFSIVSSLIYDFAIVCSPLDFIRVKDTGWVTKDVEVQVNQHLLDHLYHR